MYDIIIVGCGPAGMTAALYARRANKKVLVFEAKNYGGQITTATKVLNYPAIREISGYDYATELYNQILDLGAEVKFETVLRIDEDKKVYTNKGEYQAKSIILATGAENRKLRIQGENELVGRGVSYCATCDGNFYKGKTVAVVGGGNTALEDTLYLSDIASKVYLIHRREELRGEDAYQEEIKQKNNCEIILSSNVISINGVEKLESIEIEDSDKNRKTIPVDGLFIAVGQEPKNEIFKSIVELSPQGYFISEDGLHTKVKGIYIAGDARVKDLRQLVTAVSDGAIAAMTAIKEMRENDNGNN